jgi:hypothetical protein
MSTLVNALNFTGFRNTRGKENNKIQMWYQKLSVDMFGVQLIGVLPSANIVVDKLHVSISVLNSYFSDKCFSVSFKELKTQACA